MRPEIVASTWRPWITATWYGRHSIAEQVAGAIALQCDAISMKGQNKKWVYGAEENMSLFYKKYSNDALEREIKLQGLDCQLWGWTDCEHPDLQADAWQKAIARWNPTTIKFDVEGGKAKANAHKTGAFLRSLGPLKRHDGSRVKAFLESYYKPRFHPEIAWYKWLTYTDTDGNLIVDGVAPQAYPMQSQNFVHHYEQMLEDYRKMETELGRAFDWHVTVPTFHESGWHPEAASLEAGLQLLRDELGLFFVGVEFWRLGWMLIDQGSEVRDMLAGFDWGDVVEPPPKEFEDWPEPERWQTVGTDLRQRGVVE